MLVWKGTKNNWPRPFTYTIARLQYSFTRLYLVCKVLLGDFNGVELCRVAISLEHHLILSELLENEQQQLVVVTSVRQVPRERLQQTDTRNQVLCAIWL